MRYTENVHDLRINPWLSEIETDVPIPYTEKHDETTTFMHADAIVLLALSEMLIGDSVLLPTNILLRDIQRLALATFPLIFTYHEDRAKGRVRVWRLKWAIKTTQRATRQAAQDILRAEIRELPNDTLAEILDLMADSGQSKHLSKFDNFIVSDFPVEYI